MPPNSSWTRTMSATVDMDHFAVHDLLTQVVAGGVRLLASHNWWDVKRDCQVLRVSMIELRPDRLLAGGDAPWQTLYDTRPCLRCHRWRRRRRVFNASPEDGSSHYPDKRCCCRSGRRRGHGSVRSSGGHHQFGQRLREDDRDLRWPPVARALHNGPCKPAGTRGGPRLANVAHRARGARPTEPASRRWRLRSPHVSYGADASFDWPLTDAAGPGCLDPMFAWVPSNRTVSAHCRQGACLRLRVAILLVSSLRGSIGVPRARRGRPRTSGRPICRSLTTFATSSRRKRTACCWPRTGS